LTNPPEALAFGGFSVYSFTFLSLMKYANISTVFVRTLWKTICQKGKKSLTQGIFP